MQAMVETHEKLSETHILGDDTKEWQISAEHCPALKGFHIKHVGVADAAVPYRMVRQRLAGVYLLACLGGEGELLLDGRWQRCREGMACIAPRHVMHAFHAVEGVRWKFCWVRYQQPNEQRPMVSAQSPVMAQFRAEALEAAIMGLWHEMQDSKDASAIHHWTRLIDGYVKRFSEPWQQDDRLWKLWQEVGQALGEEWNLDRLSRISFYSAEHLRRICLSELGRSPMRHVTFLRMQRASELLETTNDTIESIAQEVGYKNPFVFSNTFKKWTGRRPSAFRRNA